MDSNELKYTNINLFYKVFYNRLFSLINLIVDENTYNIRKIEDQVKAFTDDYSYYIIGKSVITIEDLEKETSENVLKKIKDFNSFTSILNYYPSVNYKRIRKYLIDKDFKIEKLSIEDYNILLKEYYEFYEKVTVILSGFFCVASENGFLPKLNSAESLRRIGYNNYDFFFQELENLKIKLNDIGLNVSINSILKSRRCMFIILELFKPYFKKKKIGEELSNELNFLFLNDNNNIELLYKTHTYESIDKMGIELQEELRNVILPLKKNVSYVRRYLSYEFGESKMAPKLEQKYDYDPTGT